MAPVIVTLGGIFFVEVPSWQALAGVVIVGIGIVSLGADGLKRGPAGMRAALANAVVIAGLHAGSIRYYSGRLTLRYDWLEPGWLDESIRVLAAKGYRPYIALEDGEEAPFRQRFEGRDRFDHGGDNGTNEGCTSA